MLVRSARNFSLQSATAAVGADGSLVETPPYLGEPFITRLGHAATLALPRSRHTNGSVGSRECWPAVPVCRFATQPDLERWYETLFHDRQYSESAIDVHLKKCILFW